MQIAGAIFDLDGTVIDTVPLALEAFQRAINRFAGRPYGEDEIIALFGTSEEGIIQRAVPERWEECLAAYIEEYEALFSQWDVKPFPGVEEALRLLRSHGVPVAVVTGKGASTTAFSLEAAGLAGAFDLLETGSPDGPVKPVHIQKVLMAWSMPPERVFYIGDSPSDMRDARQVGVIALGAAWAPTADAEALAAQCSQATFVTTQQFIKWIACHLGHTGIVWAD